MKAFEFTVCVALSTRFLFNFTVICVCVRVCVYGQN